MSRLVKWLWPWKRVQAPTAAQLRQLQFPAVPSVLYLAARWVMRIVSLAILLVRHRREASSLLAWVLTILFMPWLGLPLFLTFGNNKLPKAYQEQHKRLQRRFRIILDELRKLEPNPHAECPPDLVPFARLVENLGGLPVTAAGSVESLDLHPVIVDRMVADIDSATHYVHVLFYIFAEDETGKRLARALSRAVERGVAVRVLVDASGSAPFIGEMEERMLAAGIEFHNFFPMRPKLRQYVRMDLRNHRKLVIVDGHTAWTGSMNAVDTDYNTNGKLHWLDMMVRVTGPVVNQLQTVFVQDWNAETREDLQQDNLFPEFDGSATIPVQVLPSGPNYDQLNFLQAILAALHQAKESVVLTTPYLVPNMTILNSLRSAILRDVKVTLIVPGHSNHSFVDMASHAYFRELLDMGVEIQQYRNDLLHAKSLTVDDRLAFVSTGNFDIRSFELNYELTLVLYGRISVTGIRDYQNSLLQHCDRVSNEIWSSRPLIKKVVQNAAKMLSPFL